MRIKNTMYKTIYLICLIATLLVSNFTSACLADYTLTVNINLVGSIPAPESTVDTIKCWDLNTEPLPPKSVVTTTGTATIIISTTTPVQLGVLLTVPNFGTVYVYADNNGNGYTSAATINLVSAAKVTRYNRVKAATTAAITDGVPLRSDFMADVERAGANSMYTSLAESLRLGEELSLAKARYRMQKAGMPRQKFFFSANSFSHMYNPTVFDPLFKDMFNFGTSFFYWGMIQASSTTAIDYARVDAEINFVSSFATPRPCAIVYWYPTWAASLSFTDLKTKCTSLVTEFITRYKSYTKYFEIINEHHDVYNPNKLTHAEANSLTKGSLYAARQAMPDCQRIVNVTYMFADYATKPKSTKRSPLRYFKEIIADGSVFEIVGIQMYYNSQDIFEIDRKLDQYAALGKPIHITEQSAPSESIPDPLCGKPDKDPGPGWHGDWSETMQADRIEQLYTLFYSKSAVEAIGWWDFMDLDTYQPWSGLIRRDNTPKQSYTRLLGLRKSYWCDYDKSPKLIVTNPPAKVHKVNNGIPITFTTPDTLDLTKSVLKYRIKEGTAWSNTWNTVAVVSTGGIGYSGTIPSNAITSGTTLFQWQFEVANSTGYFTVTPLKTFDIITITPPTSVSVKTISDVYDKLKISWAASTSAGIKDYMLYRSVTSGSGYVKVVSTGIALGVTSYYDSGLESNKSYYYVLTSRDELNNESAYSKEASSTTVTTDLTAPVNVSVLSSKCSELRIGWTVSTSVVLKDYILYRSTTPGSGYVKITSTGIPPGVTSYVDTGLGSNKEYYYVLTSRDTGNNESEYSNQAAGTTTNILPPTNVYAFSSKQGVVTIEWAASVSSGFKDYILYRSTSSGSGYISVVSTGISSNSTIYYDNGLEANKKYYYALITRDALNKESQYSNETSFTVIDLSPPVNVSAKVVSNKCGELIIEWEESSSTGVKDYILYRSLSPGSGYVCVVSTGIDADANSYIDSGLENNRKYYYVLTARDMLDGESAYSNIASSTTIALQLKIPSGLTVTNAGLGTQLNLVWAINTELDFSKYAVYRNITNNYITSVLISTVTVNSYSDKGLVNNTTYYYWLRAFNTNGDGTQYSLPAYGFIPYSSTATVTVPVPEWISSTDEKTGGVLTLNWEMSDTISAIVAFNIYRATAKPGPYKFITNVTRVSGNPAYQAYQDTNLINNTSYYYKLTAVDNRGNESSKSADLTGYPTIGSSGDNIPPSVPTGLTITPLPEGYSLFIEWKANTDTGLKEYMVYRAEEYNGTYIPIFNTLPNKLSFTDTQLENEVTYYYRIAAVDTSQNSSDYSAVVSGIPHDETPPVISCVTILPITVMEGTKIRITFVIDEQTECKVVPVVKVNNNLATYENGYVDILGNYVDYSYGYVVTKEDLLYGRPLEVKISAQNTSGQVSSVTKNIAVFVTVEENTTSVMPNIIRLNQSDTKLVIQYRLMEDAAYARVEVYNTAGELVRSLPVNSPTRGVSAVEWDGKNDNGEPVASGIYLVQFISDIYKNTKKVVVIK
ncbi:MAG: FlgD immunoglobulin-like domain containing protein [Elusimicrobiota bacterium]